MLRYVVPPTNATALACPNCGLVHRYLRAVKNRRGEIICACGAQIVFAEEIVVEVTAAPSPND